MSSCRSSKGLVLRTVARFPGNIPARLLRLVGQFTLLPSQEYARGLAERKTQYHAKKSPNCYLDPIGYRNHH